MDGWMDRFTDERTDGMVGWMDEWLDRYSEVKLRRTKTYPG